MKHEFSTKAALELSFRNMIANSPVVAMRALMVVYNNQTEDEKVDKTTKHHNGMGFNSMDDKICSSMAEQLIQKKMLSEKQTDFLRKVLPKYAKQLVEYSISTGRVKHEDGKYRW